MNFYPFHLGDYAAHTKHLSLLEDLAYRRMIDLYYTNESPLPLDPEKVARLIGMRDHMQEVSDVLSDFFVKSENGYTNSRCDKEIQSYKAKADRAKSANKSRWGTEKSDSFLKSDQISDVKSDADRIPTNNQEPITKNQEPLFKTNTPAAPDIDAQEFEVAWISYPRRPGASKADSLKAWKARIKSGASASEMLAGVERYAAFVRANGTEPQFIKQPQTFFGPGEHYKADWSVSPRASPARYESEKDRSRRETYEALTGRKAHDQRHDIIDI